MSSEIVTPVMEEQSPPVEENNPPGGTDVQESVQAPSCEESGGMGRVMIDEEEEGDGEEEAVGLPYEDHNYDTVDPANRVKDSTVFPILPPLADLGINDEDVSHDSAPMRADKTYYEQPNVMYSRGASRTDSGMVYRSASDVTRKVLIGGNNYTFPPGGQQHSVAHGFKQIPRSDYGGGSSSAQYVVSGYGSTQTQRRLTHPMGTSQNVTMQKKPGRPKTMSRVMPTVPSVPQAQAEPPHRAMLTGKSMPPPPPPTAYQPTDGSDAIQAPRGGAPLLVAGRGAKPVIRGRAAAGTLRKKDGAETDENVLDDGHVVGRATSPRKAVNFVDGIPPGGGATMASASGTVNLVVGAPPPGAVSGGSGLYQQTSQETDWQTEEAVQQNLAAIRGSLDSNAEPVPPREPSQPLPAEIQKLMTDGEVTTRTLNINEMVKYKASIPDVPPDPIPEPRPRGRPKGSTNRNRANSSSNPALGSSPLHPAGSQQLMHGGSSPPRGSPTKLAPIGSPQRGVGVRSPSKSLQGEESDSLAPLVPPIVPSLGANAPSPAPFPPACEAGPSQAQAIHPAYTPRAVYNIPVNAPSSIPQSKGEDKLDGGREGGAEMPPPFSNGKDLFSSSTETEGSSSDEDDEDSDESGAVSDDSVTTNEEEWGDYTTRCHCGLIHNDEDMIECEKCNVWQHMKCLGVNPKKVPEHYYCEMCEPRQLKWNQEQARDYQERKLRELEKAKEKRRTDRRKRNEERKKARERKKKTRQLAKQQLKQKEKARKKAAKPASGLQFRKYTEIGQNEYSARAKTLLASYPTTNGAIAVMEGMRNSENKYGRMFVAPAIEGIVAIKDIQKNDLVMEYLGHVCVPPECPGREKEGFVQPYTVLYSGLNNHDCQLVIDARRKGGDSRFVRRSCRPNTVLRHVVLNGCIHVLLNATEDIEKSMEVTIPFDSDYQLCPRALQCACGDDASCPIADFNASKARSPSPLRRKSASGAPPSTRKPVTTPTPKSVKPRGRPSSGKSTPAVKTPNKKDESSKRGRPPKIKLRRPEGKESKKDDDAGKEEKKEEEEEAEEITERRSTRRREVGKHAAESDPPVHTPEVKDDSGEKRISKRLRRGSAGKVEVKEEEDMDEKAEEKEAEEWPRKRTRMSTISSVKSEKEEERPAGRARRSGKAVEKEAPKKEEGRKSLETQRKTKDKGEKGEMDYTLPEDRHKLSREERKLQQELALIAKLEEKEKHHPPRKSASPVKETARRGRSVPEKEKEKERERQTMEKKEAEANVKKEQEEEPRRGAGRPVRSSPRKESQSQAEPPREETPPRVYVPPPRKRWQQEQELREREEAEAAAAAAAAAVSPAREIPTGGKKAWLLRRAQADKDEPAPPDPAPSVPLQLPRPAEIESRTQLSPPLKKRRPILEPEEDVLRTRTNEAARMLTQMATASQPKDREPGIRELMVTYAQSLVASGGPLTFVDGFTLPEGPDMEWPPVSSDARKQKEKRRLTLDEYKRRRESNVASTGEQSGKKKSFIPSIQDVEGSSLHLAPVPDPKALSSAPLADLDELKRRIYGHSSTEQQLLPPPPPEPCLAPPPPPPQLPRNSPSKASSSRSPQKAAQEEEDEDRPRARMSLADRLKVEFGI